jgi:hypothetical protein
MILRDKLKSENNVEQLSSKGIDSTYKPKISVPVILQEAEGVTNAAIENIESDYVKIWVPK